MSARRALNKPYDRYLHCRELTRNNSVCSEMKQKSRKHRARYLKARKTIHAEISRQQRQAVTTEITKIEKANTRLVVRAI